MGLISAGIERVRVFALAAGVGTRGGAVHEATHAMVTWRSAHEDKLHQVYADGRLAGVTEEFGERRMVVALPSRSGVRVEVFAVGPGEADADFGGEMLPAGSRGRVELRWPKRAGLPGGGVVRVWSNGGCGEIDYEKAAEGEIEIRPAWQEQGGFGMGRMGEGDFGYDGAASAGFGRGAFGEGEFGFDEDAMRWLSGELDSGVWRFGVKAVDAAGNESEAAESGDVVVVRKAGGAGEIGGVRFDEGDGRLTIELE